MAREIPVEHTTRVLHLLATDHPVFVQAIVVDEYCEDVVLARLEVRKGVRLVPAAIFVPAVEGGYEGAVEPERVAKCRAALRVKVEGGLVAGGGEVAPVNEGS